MDVVVVILIIVFIRFCMVLELSIGIIISGMMIRNWIYVVCVGMLFLFSLMVFLLKMFFGILEKKIFIGVVVYISRELNIVVKDIRLIKWFINVFGRLKYVVMLWNICIDLLVNFNFLLLMKMLISIEEMEYSMLIKILVRMIILMNDFELFLMLLMYIVMDFVLFVVIKIQVVMLRNV